MNDYVARQMKKILSEYELTTVEGLVKNARCKILYFDMEEETGGLTVSSNRCHTLIINSNYSDPMQNFVILHEFAHIKLHPGVSTPFYKRFVTSSFIPKIEREANELALGLLLMFQDQDEISILNNHQLIKYLGLPDELERFL